MPEVYDDGGLSGGNVARPGLQHLIADVVAIIGTIDIVLGEVDR